MLKLQDENKKQPTIYNAIIGVFIFAFFAKENFPTQKGGRSMLDGTYNRLPFNRGSESDISFSVTFESETEIDSTLNLEMPMEDTFESETEFNARIAHPESFGSMFGGPFNRLPFNREQNSEVVFAVTFESETEVDANLNLEMSMAATFESETELAPNMTREVSFGAEFNTSTEMLAQMVRERLFAVDFETQTEFMAKPSYFHIDEIEFIGEFKPGDKIIIDSGKFKITQNGQNVSHLYEGDFFDLNLGKNNLTYTDPETGRQVLIRITHRDKFLY